MNNSIFKDDEGIWECNEEKSEKIWIFWCSWYMRLKLETKVLSGRRNKTWSFSDTDDSVPPFSGRVWEDRFHSSYMLLFFFFSKSVVTRPLWIKVLGSKCLVVSALRVEGSPEWLWVWGRGNRCLRLRMYKQRNPNYLPEKQTQRVHQRRPNVVCVQWENVELEIL